MYGERFWLDPVRWFNWWSHNATVTKSENWLDKKISQKTYIHGYIFQNVELSFYPPTIRSDKYIRHVFKIFSHDVSNDLAYSVEDHTAHGYFMCSGIFP